VLLRHRMLPNRQRGAYPATGLNGYQFETWVRRTASAVNRVCDRATGNLRSRLRWIILFAGRRLPQLTVLRQR
jgi:hypothetical protein